MTKEKQIEEMAKFVCNACEMGCGFDGECSNFNNYKTCGISTETAEAIYNAGYRKANEVATEIFEKVGKLAIKFKYDADYSIFNMQKDFAELKKKYEVKIDE